MGNTLLCLNKSRVKYKKRALKNLLMNEPSGSKIPSNKEVSKCQDVQPSASLSFQWSVMDNMILEYKSNIQEKKLTLQDFVCAEKVFSIMENDIAYNCKKIYDRMIRVDGKYFCKFEEHANFSKIPPQSSDICVRSLTHIVCIMQMHKKILNALQFGQDAFKYLDLIALSHSLMNVSSAEFRLLNIIFGKHLISLDDINEESVRPLITYLNLVTNYICGYLDKRTNHENMLEDITSFSKSNFTDARKNYRQMKKWRNLVELVRKETEIEFKEVINNVDIIWPKDIGNQDSEEKIVACYNL